MSTSVMRSLLALLRKEKNFESCIPYSSTVAPGVVMGRKGELYASWRCEGIPFETVDPADQDAATRMLNTFLRSLPDAATIVVHRVRRPMQDHLQASCEPGFARDFSLAYNRKIGGFRLMATEFYVTIMAQGVNSALRGRESAAEHEARLNDTLKDFANLCSSVDRSLARFGAQRLTCYSQDGAVFSEQLSLYNFLVSLDWHPVRVTQTPLWKVLADSDVYLAADILEVVSCGRRTMAQGLEIKDFCQVTTSGLLDHLLYPDVAAVDPYPFIETQTFKVMSKSSGQKFLTLQQKQLASAEDAGGSQISALTEAIDQLIDGDFVLGEYSYGLLVLGDDEAHCRKNCLDAAEKLKKAGLLPVQSGLALGGLFLSQLPGNLVDRPRIAALSSLNFAHFAPFHNLAKGKRDHNPWGEAVIMLTTPADQPYYFNFHTSPALEKSEGKKTLANTTVIGTSGSGKTVFLNTCLAMAQKYRTEKTPLTTVFFDKDRGAEIAIRAMGGGYLTVQNGTPTSFNPFQLDETEENIQFLIAFVKLLITQDGQPLTTSDELKLSQAIRAVMTFPKAMRRLGLLPQNIVEGTTVQEQENSISKRLTRWIHDQRGHVGDLAWVFDNRDDTLDFNRYPNFGIDGTDFLDNKEVRTPIAYYLLYRMEKVLDGRRFIFIMDEFWKWLLDEAFSDFAFNKLKTIRKQNGFGIFATQSPSDVINSPIAAAVLEQSATQVFLPNPKANADEYIKGFKLTQSEFEVIRNLGESSRQMLVKQGHSSAICELDLGAFPDALQVLSGSTDNILLEEKIRGQVGDDPAVWLTIFLQHSHEGKK